MHTRLACCVTLALALASLVVALLLFLPRTRLHIVRSEHRKLWAVLVAGSKGEFKVLPKLLRFQLYLQFMSKQSHPRLSVYHLKSQRTKADIPSCLYANFL